jgi:sulfonate transport system substrate-binding protein
MILMKNKMTKFLSSVLIIIFLFSLSVTTFAAQEVEKLAISYVKLPLNVPSIVEKEKQLFEKEFNPDGIEVEFPEITQGSKMTQAVAAGSLDFCNALGGTSLILAAANGVKIKMIGVYSRAPKAFNIMAKDPSIKTTADLRGKKVVGPKGTILHQLLLASLVENNLSLDDLEFVNLGIARGISALLAESADAALVAGPAVPQALENGAHIIESGEGLLDATIVIAVSGEFADKHPVIVDRYLKVHQESLKFMEENPEDTLAIVAKETGISKESVKKMYSWYDFNPEITESDIKELTKTQDFLLNNGMLSQSIDIESLIVE